MVRVLIKISLIFVLVYAAVSIWYGRLEEKLQQDLVVEEIATVQLPEKKMEILRKPDDYTIIINRNIFQAVVVKKEKEVKVEVVEKPKPTKLKLSLMGTISGNKERDARAIISDDVKRKQDIYQVGDSVQGAAIKSINRAKVVLLVNGKEEVLTLKDREGGGPAYNPSPSDFYKEPPQQVHQQPVRTDNVNEQPFGTPRKQPTVRPRPVRRPLSPRATAKGFEQKSMEK